MLIQLTTQKVLKIYFPRTCDTKCFELYELISNFVNSILITLGTQQPLQHSEALNNLRAYVNKSSR